MRPALFIVWLVLVGHCANAGTIPDVLNLWPGAAPGSEKLTITEKITERSTNAQRPDRIYTQIVTPSITVHRPAKPNGVAVIIAPGGGYQRIVIDKEGPDTSAWLNSLGVTAFVLKYRLPGEGHEHAKDVPLQDAQRALRLVRSHAAEWGLETNRIGFLGYSAGGNLAALMEFYSGRKIYTPVDAFDESSARPDFCVLGYAALNLRGAGAEAAGHLSPLQEMGRAYRIEATPGVTYPPAFILHADDDPTVDPKSAATIYLALKKNGTPCEMHVFRTGGHGFGIRDAKGPVAVWPQLCGEWLEQMGILPTGGSGANKERNR